MMFAYIVAVVSAVALTSAYPTGAPTSACFDMIPGHAAEVQKGPAPYTITSAVTAVKAGHSVDVVVSGKKPEDFFRGILLQARQGDKIVGTWTIPATDKYSQLMNCGEPGNAVTHISRDDKHTLSYSWTAPDDLEGEIVFLVTIVKTYAEFWVKIPSATIQILSQH